MPEYICLKDRVWTGKKLYRKGDDAVFKAGVIKKDDTRFQLKSEYEKELAKAEEARNAHLVSGKTDEEMFAENQHLKSVASEEKKKAADLAAEVEALKKQLEEAKSLLTKKTI